MKFTSIFSSKRHQTPIDSDASFSSASSSSTASSSQTHQSKKSWSFGSGKLSHFLPHSKKHAGSASSSPPRRPLTDMKPPPGPTPSGTSLLELMHAERQSSLTQKYMGRFVSEIDVGGEKVAIKRHDGDHAAHHLRPTNEAKQAKLAHSEMIHSAIVDLDELVRNAPRGLYDDEIEAGIVPEAALEGREDWSKEDLMDIVIGYQKFRSQQHDIQVRSAADDLNFLLPNASEEEAEEFLRNLRGTSPPESPEVSEAEDSDSDEIQLEESPEEVQRTLAQSLRNLPERRLADVIDTYLENRET